MLVECIMYRREGTIRTLTRRCLHFWQPYLDFLCPRRGPLRMALELAPGGTGGPGGSGGPGGPEAPGAAPTADILVTFYRVVPKW